MDLHLTTLPAEIRDLIYEYALTETDGVCCREDENGVVWLCLCEPEAEDKAECIQITEKERASQVNETDASRAVLASTEGWLLGGHEDDPKAEMELKPRPGEYVSVKPGGHVVANQL
jgi:hypothetical protein